MMQSLVTVLLGGILSLCQIRVSVGDAISLETPSKEHLDHFKIQEAIHQEVDSEECRFDNYTWDRVIAERKQEMRWEARVEAYKAGLITTGLMVDETEKHTHWTDRYSGFWFPHNFRRRRRSAVSDLVDRYREQEILRNADQGRRQRDVKGLENTVVEQDNLNFRAGLEGAKYKQGNARHRRSLEANDIMNLRPESDISAQHRRLMAKLRRKLLSRRKRHLYEDGKELLDHYAFQAKEYNYYDYNNMLTAVPLPSSTIKFVEEVIRNKPDVKQGADVHHHNMKHKEVFGGFHNDSELLTFLRNYHHKNYTHEERKLAWYDDFMRDRIDTRVEYFKKNLANYKRLYRSFREKSNREKNNYVNPDTEDQSAIIPHFDEHHVMNYTELYRYFRAACEHAEEKSSEIEPTPVNHYMPANYTSSPESQKRTYWSGESEAFVSDYDNERFNTSGWTRSKKRKRAVGPRVYGRINIQVYDGYDNSKRKEKNGKAERNNKAENSQDVNENLSKTVKDKNAHDETNRNTGNKVDDINVGKNGDKGYHRSINEIVRRNGNNIDVRENIELDSVGNKHKEHVKRIDIRFQINQDNGASDDTRDAQDSSRGKPNSLKARSEHSDRKFNVLNEILDLINGNVNSNLINNMLSKVLDGKRTKQSNNGMDTILNLVENLVGNKRRDVTPFKGFEIYETQLNNQDNQKEKIQSRVKRSVEEPKYLTVSKIIKTIQANNEYALHLLLEPTLESVAFEHQKEAKAIRFRRNAAGAAKQDPREEDNEEEEEPQDPNECPLMKRVFYWKKVREANKHVVMSHEKSIEAVSMNDYYKRRDREPLASLPRKSWNA
uniref:Uncharacterized protein n=1 Tax=Cacopsylla melanoneura TaxID=428564 RepID=A0A8D8RFS3_9HEMI